MGVRQPGWGYDVNGGGLGAVVVLDMDPVDFGCDFVWAGLLALGYVLGLVWAAGFILLIYLCYFYFSFLFSIIPYQFSVGLSGLCLSLCTQCVLSDLVRWRAVQMIKWMQSPSCRMKRNIDRSSTSQQHIGKAGLISLLW